MVLLKLTIFSYSMPVFAIGILLGTNGSIMLWQINVRLILINFS